jgi:hypothetical protein
LSWGKATYVKTGNDDDLARPAHVQQDGTS